MFCEHCGKENKDETRFCENCGKQFAVPEAQPPVQQSTPLPVCPPTSAGDKAALTENDDAITKKKKTTRIVAFVVAAVLLLLLAWAAILAIVPSRAPATPSAAPAAPAPALVSMTAVGAPVHGLSLVTMNGLYGVVDVNGMPAVPCIYDEIELTTTGARLRKGSDWREVTLAVETLLPTVKEVAPCIYSSISLFSDGLAHVYKYTRKPTLGENINCVDPPSKSGFIDTSGNEVIPLMYDYASDFSEGLAHVCRDLKYGFIGTSGNEVIPFIYDYAGDFSEGLAHVCRDLKYGFIDTSGNEVIPLMYDYAGDFSEGLAAVENKEGHGFIDTSGNEVIPCMYDGAGDFSEGLAHVYRDLKYGFVDKSGNEVAPLIYDYAGDFSEGLASVKREGKYGFIDKSGNEVIPLIYGRTDSFSEGLAAVERDGKLGFIDKSGNEVIPFIYDDSTYIFSEGLAAVGRNGKWGFIDKSGNEVVPLIYDKVNNFSDGLASVKKDGKLGIIDKTGNEVAALAGYSVGVYFDRVNSQESFDEGLMIVTDSDNNHGLVSITMPQPFVPLTQPQLDNLLSVMDPFSRGAALVAGNDAAGGNALLEQALLLQPENPYIAAYMGMVVGSGYYATPAARSALYSGYITNTSGLLRRSGGAETDGNIAQMVAGSDLSPWSFVPDAPPSTEGMEFLFAISIEDFNTAAHKLAGDSATEFLPSDFQKSFALQQEKTLSDPTLLTFTGLGYDIVYSESEDALLISKPTISESCKLVSAIESINEREDGIDLTLSTLGVARGGYDAYGFRISPNGEQFVLIDRYGEVPVPEPIYQALLNEDDYDELERLIGEAIAQYSATPVTTALTLSKAPDSSTSSASSGSSPATSTPAEVSKDSYTVTAAVYDEGTTEEDKDNTGMTEENTMETSTNAFQEYYLSFLSAINALDGSLIDYCTEPQKQRQNLRIYEFNEDYIFENTSMDLDIDSYRLTYQNGVPTVYFNVRCLNDMYLRDVNNAPRQTNNAPQSVVMVYEDSQWKVIQTMRSDAVKIGSNTTDIS